MVVRIFFAGLLAAVLAAAQARFPMKYLDDVGHLGDTTGFDTRKSVDLSVARVFPDGDGILRFEGHDKTGKPWRVWLPQAGGTGYTDIWTADFDRDGQKDLLIAAYFSQIGRCNDGNAVTVLQFDKESRPVPWTVTTSRHGKKSPFLPAIILHTNEDGRAELVTTDCNYPDPDRTFAGEDRGITGVYEAHDVRMAPLRSFPIAPYLIAAKKAVGGRDVKVSMASPAEFPDQLRGFDAPAMLTMIRMTAGERCGSDFNIVNGRIEPMPDDDPCRVLREDRILYSDGHTRLGFPQVVIDGAEGRDIYIANNEEALRRIMSAGYRFKVLGDDKHPAWLWVQLP